MKNQKELINKLLFGKYQIIKSLGKGSFSNVYLAKNTKTEKYYAVKIEEKISAPGYLEKEACFLYLLKGFGVPELISYGHHGKYNVLIEQLLGKSLKELFKTSKNRIKDTCICAIQLIDRLKYIHSKFIVHRDIKPENFLVGNPDFLNIYIVDFGLSRKYRSSRTGKHIEFRKYKTTPGTTNYLSLNATQGIEQTRRDDLESLAYLLIYLSKGKLPWCNLKGKTSYECAYKVFKMKFTISLSKLCKDLPNEFITFTKYTRQLKFDEDPNYNYLKILFTHALKTMKGVNDLKFTWIKTGKSLTKAFSEAVLKNRNPVHKSSSRARLLKQIENPHSSENVKTQRNNSYSKENSKNLILFKNDIKINDKTFSPNNSTMKNINNKNTIFPKQNLQNNIKMNQNSIIKSQTRNILTTKNNYINSSQKNLSTNNNVKNVNIGNFVQKITNNIICNDNRKKYLITRNNVKIKNMVNSKIRDQRKSFSEFSTINEKNINRKNTKFTNSMKYIPLMQRTSSMNSSNLTNSYIIKNDSFGYTCKDFSPINTQNILNAKSNRINNLKNNIINHNEIYFNNSNSPNNFEIQTKFLSPNTRTNNDYKTFCSIKKNNFFDYKYKSWKYNSTNSLNEGENNNKVNDNTKEKNNKITMFKFLKKKIPYRNNVNNNS